MMQGIQMAKEVAQKELSDQKTLYEGRIKILERELVRKTSTSVYFQWKDETFYVVTWLADIRGSGLKWYKFTWNHNSDKLVLCWYFINF